MLQQTSDVFNSLLGGIAGFLAFAGLVAISRLGVGWVAWPISMALLVGAGLLAWRSSSFLAACFAVIFGLCLIYCGVSAMQVWSGAGAVIADRPYCTQIAAADAGNYRQASFLELFPFMISSDDRGGPPIVLVMGNKIAPDLYGWSPGLGVWGRLDEVSRYASVQVVCDPTGR
jgi:hypothetical protein